MYERQFLEAAVNNDTVRMEAIKRLNDREYAYKTVHSYDSQSSSRDRLIAIWGQAYEPRCKS